jgi:hypothetical protein
MHRRTYLSKARDIQIRETLRQQGWHADGGRLFLRVSDKGRPLMGCFASPCRAPPRQEVGRGRLANVSLDQARATGSVPMPKDIACDYGGNGRSGRLTPLPCVFRDTGPLVHHPQPLPVHRADRLLRLSEAFFRFPVKAFCIYLSHIHTNRTRNTREFRRRDKHHGSRLQ